MDLAEQSSATLKTQEDLEDTTPQEATMPGSPEYQFLTFTDFQQTTDPRTKRKVRSHAMQRVHRALRSGGRGRSERHGAIPLEVSLLQGESALQQLKYSQSFPGPSSLGAGRSNPFASYPIPMNTRSHELLDHLRGDYCPMFKTMTAIGFYRILTDPAGFRQILGTSACHMEKLRAIESLTSEAIALSTQAIQSVNSRLADPAVATSDGILATILAFCCHGIMFHDMKTARTHLNGLEEIIRLRGGLESLASSPVLRIVLFWADTNIAFAGDLLPRFPVPTDLLPLSNMEQTPNARMPLAESCSTTDLANAMKDLHKLNDLLSCHAKTRDVWSDGVFAGLNLVPVLHKFLAIRHDYIGQVAALRMDGACRAGAILYLALIRAKFGVGLVAHVHVRALKNLLESTDDLIGHCNISIQLWLLALGSLQSWMKDDHEWFVSKLAEVIVLMSFRTWEEVLLHIRAVLWIESLADGQCEELRQEISGAVRNSYNYEFT